jgi:uncharacterized protein YycO
MSLEPAAKDVILTTDMEHPSNDLKGDIVLVYGRGFEGDVIDYVEHSKYAHTAGFVAADKLVEINTIKTEYVDMSMYKGTADVFTCDTLTDEQRDLIAIYIISQLGTHYDWILSFLEGIRYIFHVMLPYKEFHNHICSTLWNDAYKSVGIDLCPNIKDPSPADLSGSKLLRKSHLL